MAQRIRSRLLLRINYCNYCGYWSWSACHSTASETLRVDLIIYRKFECSLVVLSAVLSVFHEVNQVYEWFDLHLFSRIGCV